jgi:hypothetical protein
MSEDEHESGVLYTDTIRWGDETQRVSGYADYGVLLGTQIGDLGDRRKLTEALNSRQQLLPYVDPVNKVRIAIDEYARFVFDQQSYHRFAHFTFAESDLQLLMQRFDQTPSRQFKNPVLFVLGYVMSVAPPRYNLEVAREVTQRTFKTWVRDVDIIRYCRLHQSLRLGVGGPPRS